MNLQPVNKNGVLEGFCLVKTVEQKQTAKGVPYLDLLLADSGGEIVAKLWDYKQDLHGDFQNGMLVKVRGTVSPFNDTQQLRVERVRPTVPEDGVRTEDFVPNAGVEGERMFDVLLETVTHFEDAQLQKLVLFLMEEYKEKLLYWPGAFKLHHAVRGGLLYHTLSILRLAQRAAELYPFIDADLLYSGVILHDLCKIQELEVTETGIASGYTVQGELIGHLVRGAIAVEQACLQLEIPEETRILVQHMLLSHHGEPEYGAAVRTKFAEAELLAQLDMLDARVYEFMQAQEGTNPGEYSARQWALDNRKIYNHGRSKGMFRANVLADGSEKKEI